MARLAKAVDSRNQSVDCLVVSANGILTVTNKRREYPTRLRGRGDQPLAPESARKPPDPVEKGPEDEDEYGEVEPGVKSWFLCEGEWLDRSARFFLLLATNLDEFNVFFLCFTANTARKFVLLRQLRRGLGFGLNLVILIFITGGVVEAQSHGTATQDEEQSEKKGESQDLILKLLCGALRIVDITRKVESDHGNGDRCVLYASLQRHRAGLPFRHSSSP
mmetsp:Transcript_22664/g.59107  ORF Transcript_22664/g.59107 Transcript_22664/m.59107 type:complete len:220 (-) Transcript_22664:1048-1707(-)